MDQGAMQMLMPIRWWFFVFLTVFLVKAAMLLENRWRRAGLLTFSMGVPGLLLGRVLSVAGTGA